LAPSSAAFDLFEPIPTYGMSQPIRVALLEEGAQSVPNSNSASKFGRAATVAIGCAVGIGIGCGVAVMQPNHTMDPALLYGASPVTLQTPQCANEYYAPSNQAPRVSFTASGSIPLKAAESSISGPVTVSATGSNGKCVTSVSLDGSHISGPTWLDKPCAGGYKSLGGTVAHPKCGPAVSGTGQLQIGFRQCANSPYGDSSGKVHAAFSFNGATSWGSGPLAGTLTLTMESSDGFCSEGITVNGQVVHSEKFWFDAPCDNSPQYYHGADPKSCVTTKTIHVR